jgi:hypothetical protein
MAYSIQKRNPLGKLWQLINRQVLKKFCNLWTSTYCCVIFSIKHILCGSQILNFKTHTCPHSEIGPQLLKNLNGFLSIDIFRDNIKKNLSTFFSDATYVQNSTNYKNDYTYNKLIRAWFRPTANNFENFPITRQ